MTKLFCSFVLSISIVLFGLQSTLADRTVDELGDEIHKKYPGLTNIVFVK